MSNSDVRVLNTCQPVYAVLVFARLLQICKLVQSLQEVLLMKRVWMAEATIRIRTLFYIME